MNEDATNAIRLNTRRFDCHNCNYLSLRTLAAKIFDVRTSFPFDRSWYVSSDVFPTMVDCSGAFLVSELSAITRFSLLAEIIYLACLVLRWESGSCWWMGLREHDARKRRAATTRSSLVNSCDDCGRQSTHSTACGNGRKPDGQASTPVFILSKFSNLSLS